MNDVAYWSRSICVPLNPLPGTSHTLKSSYISNNTIRMPVPPLKFMRFFLSHLHVHSLQALCFYHHFESQHFSVCILFISIRHYILGLLLFTLLRVGLLFVYDQTQFLRLWFSTVYVGHYVWSCCLNAGNWKLVEEVFSSLSSSVSM